VNSALAREFLDVEEIGNRGRLLTLEGAFLVEGDV
jgi:hypothetical protein